MLVGGKLTSMVNMMSRDDDVAICFSFEISRTSRSRHASAVTDGPIINESLSNSEEPTIMNNSVNAGPTQT